MAEYGRTSGASEWADGWKPLVAGFLGLATGWNFANIVSGLFLKPMQADFGWSRTELSFGPIAGLIVALLMPLAGVAIDRFGARRVAIAGIAMFSSAYFLLAAIPAERAFYYFAIVWLSIGGTACTSIVFARGVTAWFNRSLGTAIGLMMTGASVSAALGVPLLSQVIESYGWRSGFCALGVATLVIGLPLLVAWFREPEGDLGTGDHARLQRDPMREIIRRPTFWKVAIASGIAALPIGGFIGHLVPFLTDKGIDIQAATGLASIFAISVGFGRIGNGILLDRLHPPLVVFVTLMLAALGSACLAWMGSSFGNWFFLAVSVGLIGLAQGAEGDYIKFFSMRLFGLGNFARVVAIMAMTISIGMSLGGLIFARIFDHFGSYEPAVVGSVLLYAAGGGVFLLIRMHDASARSLPASPSSVS